MSDLRVELDNYLAIRRSLGFELHRPELLLADFVLYLEANDADAITTANAFGWATQPPNGGPSWWGQRLSVVRAFARHLHAIDPAHEVPPAGLLPARTHRATPYLYSDADIAALMAAARQFRSPLRAATFETLVGLLVVTGLRIGEALRLDRGDVDLVAGVLRVRDTKFGKSREVPLHPSTVGALAAYARSRDRLCRRPVHPSFFVSTTGTRLLYCNAHVAWLERPHRRRWVMIHRAPTKLSARPAPRTWGAYNGAGAADDTPVELPAVVRVNECAACPELSRPVVTCERQRRCGW